MAIETGIAPADLLRDARGLEAIVEVLVERAEEARRQQQRERLKSRLGR